MYEVDYEKGTIKFLRRICPRCGSVMAYHKVPVLGGPVVNVATQYLSRLRPDKC